MKSHVDGCKAEAEENQGKGKRENQDHFEK